MILALTGVPGVGFRIAEAAARMTNVNARERIGNLTEEQVDQLEELVVGIGEKLPPWMLNRPLDRGTGESRHLISTELETSLRDDTNLMKMIRSYKGIRHERGQKVRGQRTKSNGRTGMAAGVLKKAAKEAGAKKAAEAPAEKKGK